jgi:hypothetical protein
MQKFAALAALAASAAAVQKGTDLMYIDSWEADVTMLPQGDGQDHTLWSWDQMHDSGASKIIFYQRKVDESSRTIDEIQELIDDFWGGMTSTEVTNQKDCELHRNEEINLYYQCTQLTFNNYALDHYGGDMRSYPRWIFDFKRCNIALHRAECCTITRNGIDYECPPCTDITLPMPTPFGPVEVPDPEPPVIIVDPVPSPHVCPSFPDLNMFSVYRPTFMKAGVDSLIEANF